MTLVTDAGVRLEFVEWIIGGPDHEEVWSWDRVMSWPQNDFSVYGDGYYYSAAIETVQRATDRKLEAKRQEQDALQDGAGLG